METGSWFAQADAMAARVNQQVSAAQARAESATRLREQIEQVQGRARSPRGEVEVTTDSTGRVTDLYLHDDALHLGADRLSQMILTTIDQARRQAAETTVEMARETFGDDSPAVTVLAAEINRQSPHGGTASPQHY